MPLRVRKIVTGGQTGADRAGLDAALELGLETGGWMPKGRRAEDGRIPEKYTHLKETRSDKYEVRTELNVRDSDCTVIFSGTPLTGGSLLTQQTAVRLGKPVLHIDPGKIGETAISDVRTWLEAVDCRVLNVAGPRISEEGSIYELTRSFLKRLLSDAD